MVGRRTVLVTVESFLVFSRKVKRGQIRPRMAARWLDARRVFLDACHHARCQLQCRAPCGAVGFGFFTRMHRVQKGFQLRAQRLYCCGRQFLKCKLGFRSRPLDANTQSISPGVIQRNILMLLEKAHLANAFGRNATGGDIGYRASRKLEAGVGDIHLVAQYRNADRLYFDHRFANQRQQKVQIVDHQVVDHVHIQAARGKNPQMVHFKKKRAIEDWLNRQHRGIESFNVAYLQNSGVLFGGSKQGVGIGKILRHGLFDQDIDSQLHQGAADFGVRDGRNGNAGGVNLSLHFLQGRERPSVEFLREGCGPCGVAVEDSRQLGGFHLAINAGVITAKFTTTRNRHTNALAFAGGRHFLSLPFESAFGSTPPATGKASIAIPAWLAAAISAWRSKSRVRSASIASAVAPEAFMVAMVGSPTTGTSKRMSCFGLLTLTTTNGLPAAMRAAREMVSSVPSMASTATHA